MQMGPRIWQLGPWCLGHPCRPAVLVSCAPRGALWNGGGHRYWGPAPWRCLEGPEPAGFVAMLSEAESWGRAEWAESRKEHRLLCFSHLGAGGPPGHHPWHRVLAFLCPPLRPLAASHCLLSTMSLNMPCVGSFVSPLEWVPVSLPSIVGDTEAPRGGWPRWAHMELQLGREQSRAHSCRSAELLMLSPPPRAWGPAASWYSFWLIEGLPSGRPCTCEQAPALLCASVYPFAGRGGRTGGFSSLLLSPWSLC